MKKSYQFQIKEDVTTQELADIINNMFPLVGAAEEFYNNIAENTRRHLREFTEEEYRNLDAIRTRKWGMP